MTSMEDYWQVKRDGVVIAHGPKDTFPSAEERTVIRSGGYKIYVDGKIYKEDKENLHGKVHKC